MARRKKRENPISTADEAVSPKGAATEAQVGSGDLQGLSDEPQAASESVRDLADEGQAFEATLVSAIENAPPADQGELKPRQVPDEDVPGEYTAENPDEPKE